MFKRYSYQGGVCAPLVIHWPKGIAARGEVRDQYHHCTDIVPTILDCCGVTMPETLDGVKQSPLPGVSMRYTFDDGGSPTPEADAVLRDAGHARPLAPGLEGRGRARAVPGEGHFDQDRWQLFHTDVDRSEANDLADQYPEKVKELVDLWFKEAEANNVLPLSDLGATGKELERRLSLEYHIPVPPSGQYTYYPGTTAVPEHSAANTHAVSYKILAEVDFSVDSQGVIFAQGSRFGGHALFVKDHTLTYAYNFIGIPPDQRIAAPAPSTGRHVVGVEFTKERAGELRESYGPLRVYVDDQVVAQAEIRTMTGLYALAGEGLCIGYKGGDAVSSEYRPAFSFTNGEVVKVVFDVADDAYVDVEQHLAAAVARD